MLKVFFSYCHADEEMRNRLETHLAMLKRSKKIEAWHDRKLDPGSEIDGSIRYALNSADIVLILISPDFLDSFYCYEVEFHAAITRHRVNETRVVPVILRPCQWKETELGGLLALPRDGRPISKWECADEAYLDVADSLKTLVDRMAQSGAKS